MERFEKDMRIILSKIDTEIHSLSNQMGNLEENIDADVRKILEEYNDKLSDLDLNAMKMRYHKKLYAIKRESLENSLLKLHHLRKEILTVLTEEIAA